jgi:eukaryotic-like serine/threonine-protein kinase
VGTPEQWSKVKEIVGEALEHSPADRGAFLDQACSGEGDLRAEVESLLAAHADAGGLSASPWAAATVADAAGEAKTIGPYRLIHRLGVGGMGQVWLAEQTEPVRRRVALKLIRAGMYDRALAQRFQSERQSQAIMEHPAIAKVFDAGTTAEGQPYFAMEYVDGLPITEYCDRKKLGIRERLKLFMQVCEGVQHAHQKAIIHRDLKPSNILVEEANGKPVPRIIDFGLAKAIVPHALGGTLYTHVGGFLGTPGYMSPEQVDSRVLDVDTRTDVYSLGVILYELLTGFLPFEADCWKKLPLDEFMRSLREQDPPRPSTRVSSDLDTVATKAQARGTAPEQLASLLRGDLDWITMKSVEKDRTRRYATPSELAADISRYLKHQPILAHPASAGYRLRKYVRRHRIAAVVAAGLFLLVVSFAAVQSVQLRRITRERDRANRITDFMTSMFTVSDPGEARGNTITAREILDKGSQDIGTGLSNDPELQAKMMYIMANTYYRLGLFSRAQPLAERAAEIDGRVLGPEHPDTLHSMSILANILRDRGHFSEAEKMLRETLERQRRVLGSDHPDTLSSMNRLGATLFDEGHFVEAEQMKRATVEIYRRVLGPDHPDTLASMNNLANALESEGHYADAEKVHRETLEIERRVLGPDHPSTLLSMNNLALTLRDEGHYPEAEKLFRETLEIRRRVLGPDHPNTLRSMSILALTLQNEGRYEEAEKRFRETLEVQRRVLGPDHPATLSTLETLAINLSHEGRYGDAEKLFREDIESAGKANQPGVLANAWYNFACGAAVAGRRDEAVEYLRKSIDLGLGGADAIAADPDLKSLQGNAHFEALLAKLRQGAAVKPH